MSTTQDTTPMTAVAQSAEELARAIDNSKPGDKNQERASKIYHGLTTQWGLPKTYIGGSGRAGTPHVWASPNADGVKERAVADPEFIDERYGDANFFLRSVAAGADYQDSDTSLRFIDEATSRSVTTPDGERALVDQSIVGAATPVEYDPRFIDIQRSATPVLMYLTAQSQPGFYAQYNTIEGRDDPTGFLSEAEAAGDLEDQFDPQSFSLSTEQKQMKIQVGLAKVSDFSQRAEQSLDFMNLRETSIGQAMIAHSLQKARGTFYGDPSVGAGDRSIEDADAFEGLAKIYDDAGSSIDKTATSSGFLQDLLDEFTVQVENTGITWDRGRYLVSPRFYNAIYNDVTPTIRIDGYDADVEYGPQGIAIGTENGSVGISPCPNIRSYSGFSGVGSTSDPGDVFLIDEMAAQIRQLAPTFTVPLGRTGLADRVALAEYYTLIDKAHGNHGLWLQGYDIPTGA